jgi:hypothetical protein
LTNYTRKSDATTNILVFKLISFLAISIASKM